MSTNTSSNTNMSMNTSSNTNMSTSSKNQYKRIFRYIKSSNIPTLKPVFIKNTNLNNNFNGICNDNWNGLEVSKDLKKKEYLTRGLADFLTDEYQLITLSKIGFMFGDTIEMGTGTWISNKGVKSFNSKPKKKKINKKILKKRKLTVKKTGGFTAKNVDIYKIVNELKESIIPVPLNTLLPISLNLYRYYYYFFNYDLFDGKKNILLIKPLSRLNYGKNKKIYLYNTIEEDLKKRGKEVITLFDNYQNLNTEMDNIENPDNLNYQIIGKNDNYNDVSKVDFVYIKLFDIGCVGGVSVELISLNRFVKNLCIGLNKMSIGGDLLIELSFLPKTLLFKQILFYLSTLFDSIEFIKDELYKNDIGMGIFLFKSLKDGKNKNKSFMKMTNHNKNGYYLKSIFDDASCKIIDKVFIKYIRDLYKDLKKMDKIHDEKMRFFVTELDRSLSTWNRFLTNHVTKNCIDWCKERGIEINNIYGDFENKLPMGLKYSLFPREKDVNMSKIKLTYESIFSVTRPKESHEISQIIKKFYPKAQTIVDCTANIGGNTIDFAKHFKNVTSIEIDPKTYEALTNNIKLYGRKNVKVVLGDYTKLKDNIMGDVFFFDPPWGGIFYRMYHNLDMYLSGINIIDLLPENFVMKAPINYNIEGLMKKFKNIIIYYITNFIFIVNMPTVDILR